MEGSRRSQSSGLKRFVNIPQGVGGVSPATRVRVSKGKDDSERASIRVWKKSCGTWIRHQSNSEVKKTHFPMKGIGEDGGRLITACKVVRFL